MLSLRAALRWLVAPISFLALSCSGVATLPSEAENGALPDGQSQIDPNAPSAPENWLDLANANGTADPTDADTSFNGDPNAAVLIGLKPGMTSTDGRIKQLQDDLIKLAYLPTTFPSNSGYGTSYGPNTTSAVQKFQTSHGLSASGAIDAATAEALRQPFGTLPPVPPHFPGAPPGDPYGRVLIGLKPGATSSDAQRIKQLHDDLIAMGYLDATFTKNSGYGTTFGPVTTAALKQFQGENGAAVSGQVDPATGVDLISPRPRPAGIAAVPAQSYRDKLGLTVGPMVDAADGSRRQDFEHGYVLVTADGMVYVRLADGTDITPPRRLGPASTLADANLSFLTQWGPTSWNSVVGAPDGYMNCGPTSVAIVLSMLGLIPHPDAANAEAVIKVMRQASGVLDITKGMGDDALFRILNTYHAHPTQRTPATTAVVDQVLSNGYPLILGTGTTWNAWGKQLQASGGYLNSGDPHGHYVTILGKTVSANYIVGDPLSKVGTIEVTPANLTIALGGAWGVIEVAP